MLQREAPTGTVMQTNTSAKSPALLLVLAVWLGVPDAAEIVLVFLANIALVASLFALRHLLPEPQCAGSK